MSKTRRVLVGDGGLGASVGTFLFIATGLGFVWRGVSDLNDTVHAQPAEQPCEPFLSAVPALEPRWVALTGCRLDLERSQVHQGQLLVPLKSSGDAPRAFVAPANAELQRLDSPQKRQAFLAEHTADLETTLAPPTLIVLSSVLGGLGWYLYRQGQQTRRFANLAMRDDLTGLPNRRSIVRSAGDPLAAVR